MPLAIKAIEREVSVIEDASRTGPGRKTLRGLQQVLKVDCTRGCHEDIWGMNIQRISFLWVSNIISACPFLCLPLSFLPLLSSHLSTIKPNKSLHRALKSGTSEVLGGSEPRVPDTPVSNGNMLTAIDFHFELADQTLWLTGWENETESSPYFVGGYFFPWENMKVKCGGQVQGDWI